MNSIINRRSIRHFLPGKVNEETIKYMIKMGMQAPSSHNQRPWQFIVIDDTEVLTAIAEMHPYAKMMQQASLGILVCGDMNQLKHDQDFWQQDCAAVTENILLAATEMGLGSVWIGIYPKTQLVANVRNIHHLPEEIIPFSYIAIGYSGEEKSPRDFYEEERVRKNRW